MAKYKHHPDTLIVLNNLHDRLEQIIESLEVSKDAFPNLVEQQTTAYRSALAIIQGAIDNPITSDTYFPESLEKYVVGHEEIV